MPKMRESYATQDEANALSQHMSRWLSEADPTNLWQTCYTCRHMGNANAFCNKFKLVPPVAVIVGVTVCDAYDDSEEIPF